jgi:hypothetical protein
MITNYLDMLAALAHSPLVWIVVAVSIWVMVAKA